MTAVEATTSGVGMTRQNDKRIRGRGRPRKVTQDHHHSGRPSPSPPRLPVSRRSSRLPRQQLREDYYNVDGILVDDEEDGCFGRKQVSEEKMEEKVVAAEEEEEDFKSKKKLKLNQNLQTKSNARLGSGSRSVSSDGDGCAPGRENDEDINEICLHEDVNRRLVSNCWSSTSGTGTPLPDSKTLMLILGKIQKKDKYGVFAEPVDPEELPDYHEVIEHPMDFGTIRKKLARNLYSSLEQFESDVLLVCSNAMQYNSPETIYFKQASSMQELAKKKFQTIQAKSNSYELIPNNVQGRQPNTANTPMKDRTRESEKCIEFQDKLLSPRPIKDQPKSSADKPNENRSKSLAGKPLENLPNSVDDKVIENQANMIKEKSVCSCSNPQAAFVDSHETIFVSNGNIGNEIKITENIGSKKPENCCASVATSVHCEGFSEKAEPLEKSFPWSNKQKQTLPDEDRHATYTKSNSQPTLPSNSLFATFESEKKLVAVGLHDQSSYARSLAQFSATLGPTVWRIASKNIEKSLPAGLKFGPGWAGEYEPPLTPIFYSDYNLQQVSINNKNPYNRTTSEKEKNNCHDLKAKEDNIFQNRHADTLSNGHTAEVHGKPKPAAVNGGIFSKNTAEGKQALFGSRLGCQPRIRNEALQLQRDRFADNSAKIHDSNQAKTDASTHARSMTNDVDIPIAMHSGYSDVEASRCMGMHFSNESNMTSNTKSENSMIEVKKTCRRAGDLPELQDGKNSSDQKLNGSVGFIQPSEADTISRSSSLSTNDQKTDDPVKVLRMLPGNVPNSCLTNTTERFISPVLSPSNFTSSSLTSNAHLWVPARCSAECESSKIYIDTHMRMHPQSSPKHDSTRTSDSTKVQIKVPTTKPIWMFPHSTSGFQQVNYRVPVPQSSSKPNQMVVRDEGFQNKSTVASPQIFSSDMPRFYGQSPWQGFVQHLQQGQKHNVHPPDLNIGFQPPGSSVQQPSSILIDSQQPDLALQL